MKQQKPEDILQGIVDQYKSVREFARAIQEDPADIFRWKAGKRKINPRAVINIVKLHPELSAHDLNPETFEFGLTFNFGDAKNG